MGGSVDGGWFGLLLRGHEIFTILGGMKQYQMTIFEGFSDFNNLAGGGNSNIFGIFTRKIEERIAILTLIFFNSVR